MIIIFKMFLCINLCLRKIISELLIGACNNNKKYFVRQEYLWCERVSTSSKIEWNLGLRDKKRNFENKFEKDRCDIALAKKMFFFSFFLCTQQLWHFGECFSREIYSVFQRLILVLQFLIPYNWRVFFFLFVCF